MAIELGRTDNGDGTTTVAIGTSKYGSASVIVRNDALDTAEIQTLFRHVENLDSTAFTAVRRSRRDAQRQGE